MRNRHLAFGTWHLATSQRSDVRSSLLLCGGTHRIRPNRRQLFFNFVINLALSEFRGDANCVLDGIGVRRAVRDETYSLDAQ